MATLFLHAAIPFALRPLVRLPSRYTKRLVIVGAVCSCLPDLDVAAYAFEIRTTEMLGHRGLAHSLFAAAVIAGVATFLFFRSFRPKSRGFWRVLGFLFAVTALHGLIDSATSDDAGVALLAPFTSHRYFFPIRILPSCQLGVAEYFSFWGLLTIANEILYALIPLALFAELASVRTPRSRRGPARTAALVKAVGWLLCVLVLRSGAPDLFSAQLPRVIEPYGTASAGKVEDFPTSGLPEERVVVKLDELRSLGLFDRELAAENPDWSSSFFPSWFGGEAGRWQEGRPRLVWRTLHGFAPPTSEEAHDWLAAADAGDVAARDRIFTLSPTEKVDLALGRYDFPASVQGLGKSHNARHLRYWNGRCNGVASASLTEPEPFRVVDVIAVDGHHVPFHPNDVKALLATAYYEREHEKSVGQGCATVSFDPGVTCSVNPGIFALAVLNRIGLAHASFLMDALPTVAIQHYAVSKARVDIVRAPYPVAGTPVDASFDDRVAALVDVKITVTLSSTTLTYAHANVVDPSDSDGSRYRRVGVVPVVMTYDATLALGKDSAILGGRWTGLSRNGPDSIGFVDGDPLIDSQGMLAAADRIPWSFVRALAHASISEDVAEPVLDLRRP